MARQPFRTWSTRLRRRSESGPHQDQFKRIVQTIRRYTLNKWKPAATAADTAADSRPENSPPPADTATHTVSNPDTLISALVSLAIEPPIYEDIFGTELSALSDGNAMENGLASNKFTCFPRLPLEIRRLIWKATLPGRRIVSLTPSFYDGASAPPAELPVAFFINQESRSVASRHYYLMFQQVCTAIRPIVAARRLICLSPAVDQVVLSCLELQQDFAVLTDLHRDHPECIEAITSLEIRDTGWFKVMTLRRRGGLHGLAPQPGMKGLLFYLKSLQHINVIPHQGQDFAEAEERSGYMYDLLAREMYSVCGADAETKTPCIILHNWRRLQPRSDVDNLYEQAIPYPWSGQHAEILSRSVLVQREIDSWFPGRRAVAQ
ncbi:uncharacterized protein L3040_008475 [Drepanopeziza brunnea f. sp. 'multigermtubi']|uniref:uncharacterized protein n=1 Tax=Drepanopeziza brunnea f. sp. 'multigermtubi' TaxID=698441 RepID=UPI002381D840|nr:hypothetical protein L3040_008475 [Drepanopeziza brunnea f. sp. 'multigermtubi']